MTDTLDTVVKQGNTSTTVRGRSFCFTLNNYSEQEYEDLKEWAQGHKYIIGKEVGKEGTSHLQGYIYTKNPIRLSTLLKINKRIHWEKAKGNIQQNLDYCSKDGEYETNFKPKTKELDFEEELNKRLIEEYYSDVIWRPWQQEMIDLIESKPDSRTINWIIDEVGNSGKSFLTKYLALKHTVIIADGKKDNVFNQVRRMLKEEKKEFRIVILDIPRSSEGYINYGVLEQLKNGLVYSGKYEGGLCIFDNVHVIVFANFEPLLSQFSEDRWNIKYI